MPRLSSLVLAKNKIEHYFDLTKKHVFSNQEINDTLYRYGSQWNLAMSINSNKFIAFLISNSHMSSTTLANRKFFLWREKSYNNLIYELALSLKPNSYLSHYTAMFFNNLTEQIPKTIYVTYERKNMLHNRNTKLTQKKIDIAFEKDERISNAIILYKDYKIILISSLRNDHIGVNTYYLEDKTTISITNIERTLIDITVRPNYSGGVIEVASAYKAAIKTAQIIKLKNYLNKINYTYPFEQAIGFYLENAGLPEKRLCYIDKICQKKYKFYLCKKIINPYFSSRWQIYYPSSFNDKK